MNTQCIHCHGAGTDPTNPALHCMFCHGLGFTMADTVFRQISERPARGGWAPGQYLQNCRSCEAVFIGDKRAWHCDVCAYIGEPQMEVKA